MGNEWIGPTGSDVLPKEKKFCFQNVFSFFYICNILQYSTKHLIVINTLCLMNASVILLSLIGNKFSYSHACLMIVGVWCYAMVFAVGPLANWGHYGPEPYGTACCIDW